MAIAYLHKETGETTDKERWRWQAVYKDGTTLDQFEVTSDGAFFHRFAEIDQSKLAQFRMVHDGYKPIVIELPEGAKLVHWYTIATIQTPSDDGLHTITTKYKGYKVGYQLKSNDHGILIDHDDSIHVINNFEAANVAKGVK